MQDWRIKPHVIVQKNQGNVNYQYAGEETSCEDLCDPKASEEATKQEEAELKLHKVSWNPAHSITRSPFLSILCVKAAFLHPTGCVCGVLERVSSV